MATITATEANRKFSELLRGVKKGRTYVITSRGEAVAELRPVASESEAEKARRKKALGELLDRLKSQPAMNLPHITRDEMHDV
ncbi:MAG: type II toxin-antitoxin system prevent-host-death family antitoxin [Acidobacteria bacterium]|nr:MAG: type II toxin-antitoxin system prevent-host-death family antitoxin [Acidobacteriota bacterium]